eukprot:460270-Rhodomonas_salina.2
MVRWLASGTTDAYASFASQISRVRSGSTSFTLNSTTKSNVADALGEDCLDAFARSIVMALAAGGRRTIHSLDITQAFIQSEWQHLPEGNPSCIFINPPDGINKEEGVVYEVLKQLYCIPNSARALHFTLDDFMKSQGFVAAGFEDSVWVCEPNDIYTEQLIFKAAFLARFDSTDYGLLTEYLGCEVIIDSNCDLTLHQSAYAERILCTYKA